MFLSTVAVKRPVLAVVINAVIVALGLSALWQLEVRQYPAVDRPVVSISTSYRGASAEVMDTEVTKRLLDRLSGIEGIRTIRSRSSDGDSRIDVEFELTRDLDLAAADVRDQIGQELRNLPEEADDPVVRKASSDASPIMWISLNSDRLDNMELTDIAERQVAERLSLVDGVSRVRVGGSRRYAMRIWLDRSAMAARGVTENDVASRLLAENLELPAGRIESRTREFSVRAVSRLRDVDEFARLVIREESGGTVRLSDVARVEIGPEDERSGFGVDGRSAASLGIIRQSNANTIDVASAVRAELDRIRPTLPPGVNLQISSDDSIFIEQSIREVLRTLGIAMCLVIAVILLFLRSFRATLVPAVSIPVSLIGALLALYVMGFSINVLTLLAAVLAIGLVVDDTIVVLENIDRRIRQEGEHPLVAAVHGAREVGFAVIATTIVLVAVFVPISFLTGTVGRLFGEFGLTLAASVVVSSLTALTLGAMLSSQLLKVPKPKREKVGRVRRAWRWVSGRGQVVVGWYGALVALAVKGRWASVPVLLGVGVLGYWLFNELPEELTPTEDQGRFIIAVDGPEGASLEYTQRQVDQIEAILDEYRDNGGPVARYITILAPGWGGASGVNTARLIVRLTDWRERDRSQEALVDELRPRLAQITGARVRAINPAGLGIRGANEPIEYAVGGPDFETARRWARQLLDEVEGDPRFDGLRADFEESRPELRLEIDRERAIDLGLDVATIGRALQTFLGGREVTEFLDRGELYRVILQARPEDRASPSDLSGIYLRSRNGELVPLAALVRAEEAGAVRDLRRVNRVPSVVVTGSVGEGTLGDALARLDEVAATRLPAGVTINYLGESLEYRESSAQLYVMFLMALLIAYLALAGQFESFRHPLVVMLTVPLGVTGGLGALWIAGYSLNIYSQIGLILLIGLMAKNGILMVEFINQLRERGMDLEDAIRRAAEIRLRPILMTASSTVLGSLPLVLASGAGAEGRQAIGVVIFGGMVFATVLTLFVIPAFYAIIAGRGDPARSPARRLEGLLRPDDPEAGPPRVRAPAPA